ncbi:uncharacterized protein LTR77_000337 [Saxophila tyrrhenica]|uniref:Zn(2)-C6 fungal-type domain-containing protein n=1 Tax=Saxophila tyrrhenica TaxID=1690608 RepID=A0AAV9PNX2_9PEZI|nr:hypothetical protein LTR77_000337 [Saxophila tyrrhenica]
MDDFDQFMAERSASWADDELLADYSELRGDAAMLENSAEEAAAYQPDIKFHGMDTAGDEDDMDLDYTLTSRPQVHSQSDDFTPRALRGESALALNSLENGLENSAAVKDDNMTLNPDSVLQDADEVTRDDIWSDPPNSSFETQPTDPDTSPPETNGSQGHHHFPEELAQKEYQLRPQNRRTRPIFETTWIDRDETGNYGEVKTREELKQDRQRRERDARRRRERLAAAAGDVVDSEADDEGGAKAKPTLHVTLNFTSPIAKQRFSNIVAASSTAATAAQNETSEGYTFRRRRTAKTSRYFSEYEQSTPELESDLTGHPSARGCFECLSLNLRCSLLDNEESWPCHACTEDDHDCELIIQPVVKRACGRCKSSRNACSFGWEEEHGEACQQCMEDGHRCIAGPQKESIRPRLSYDWDWANDPLLKRKALKLLEDPLAFKIRRERPTHVSAVGPSSSKRKRVAAEESDSAVDVQSSTPKTIVRPAPLGPGTAAHGITKTITTKLCHPIKFNHVDGAGGSKPCHFCDEPSLAILGLGAKEVEVIEWQDGRGLEEVQGGHAGDRVDNTRICPSCTVERMSTIVCREHKLALLPEATDVYATNTALAELLSGDCQASTKWCSICPSLAEYQCATVSDGCRCGLRLCANDMTLLVGMYDGDLQKMLAEIKDEPSEARIFGLKADYELLKHDGLLMKYVLWSSG